jgi:DNA-binding response OmpR family regulator
MTDSMHEGFVSALLVGEYENDRMMVHDVFRRAGWRLFEARDRRRALECLDRHPVQVVLAGADTRRWSWKRILSDFRQRVHPPQLIVTSRTADDSLWAEVLNIGGYDLLTRPFEADELERVIASARRHYDRATTARPLLTLGAA